MSNIPSKRAPLQLDQHTWDATREVDPIYAWPSFDTRVSDLNCSGMVENLGRDAIITFELNTPTLLPSEIGLCKRLLASVVQISYDSSAYAARYDYREEADQPLNEHQDELIPLPGQLVSNTTLTQFDIRSSITANVGILKVSKKPTDIAGSLLQCGLGKVSALLSAQSHISSNLHVACAF